MASGSRRREKSGSKVSPEKAAGGIAGSPPKILDHILHAIPQAVFWKDRQSTYLGCNTAFAGAAGLQSSDDVIGKTDFDLPWLPSESEAFRADDRAVMEQDRPRWHIKESIRLADGRSLWVDTSKVPLRDGSGNVIGVLGVFNDITESRKVEETLGYRLAFEKLIAGISTRFINLRSEEIDAAVQDALRDIGLFMDVDRSYVFLFREDGRLMDNTHEWCAEGIDAHVGRLKGLRSVDFPSVDGQIRRGESVVIQVSELGPDHAIEKAEFERENIRSLILVPMSCRERILGFLGLDAVREARVFGADGMALLRIAGECLANGLERKRYEETLSRENAFRKAIIDRAAEGLCVCHEISEAPNVRFTVWNNRMIEITGYTMDEINACGWYQTVYPDPEVRERAAQRMARMRTGEDILGEEWEITRKDGLKRTIAISTTLVPGPGGTPHVLALMRDLTERKHAEEEHRRLQAQVQHVQKLESLGVLAGGIAHDFNNLLMAILGNADLAMRSLSNVSPAQGYLRDIETASRRAADLCRQMLAYSGKGRFVVETLNLNEVVEEMTRMLEVSISKKAVLKYNLAANLPAVEADATQMRQVLMNLITNASEAIGERSGVISIATGAMRCDRSYLTETYLSDHLADGMYVYVEVADTGCGMTPEVRGKIFDPFFTTKFTGRGLGMAAVLGIVRGHRGAIKVYSEPGKGTTIKVLFPVSEKTVVQNKAERGPLEDWKGRGTVLVVDDEETVRVVTEHMLELMGFQVLLSNDGRAAMEVFRERQAEITCVLLDLTMPHMDGEETYREMRRIDKNVRVIMSSGYNEQEVTQRFVGKGLAGFIQKPFQYEALRAKLREVLGGETTRASGT